MKKTYENIEINLILLSDDVVRASQQYDNVEDLPDFPETLLP